MQFIPSSEKNLWALVDCNNFYASCETLFRPDLLGKPVVVLSNNDGCFIARSKEAKALGIPMGEPWFKHRALLEKHHVEIFSANFALYGDISNRIMAILETLCPDHMEQYSIDEAFLRIEGAARVNLEAFCRTLRDTVHRWTGITVSVGVGASPTLAKLANRIAKKHPRYDGLYSLARRESEIDAWLKQTSIEDIWGIGKGHKRTLNQAGITTAYQLKTADDGWIRKQLTIIGLATALELRGITCLETWENPDEKRRTILHSRSFGNRIHGLEELSEAVATFTARCAERLRQMKLLAGGISVYVRTSHYDEQSCSRRGTAILTFPTDDTALLIKNALRVLREIFLPGHPYAKAGVMLFGLEQRDKRQVNLFEPPSEKSTRRMEVVDLINARYGKLTMRYAAMGLHKADWHMRQERRSPDYLCDWQELPVVKLE